MDNEVLNIINNLTDGKYAEEYFTNLGLKSEDINEIRNIFTNNLNNQEFDTSLIELELYLLINKYLYEKQMINTYEKELTNSYDEKLLIYKFNSSSDKNNCVKCKKELIKDFKYCPYCGNENITVTTKLVVNGEINLDKGFITPDELKYIRFLTPDEEKLVQEGKVKFDEVGIALDETNTPYEIKNELISKNNKLRNNNDLREKLFNQNLNIHKKLIANYQLSLFEDLNKIRNLKVYPPSVIENKEEKIVPKQIKEDVEKPIVKPGEKRKKYIKIISKPSISKTKEKSKDNKEELFNQEEYRKPIEELRINLKYAGILYLIDAIKHPKNPQIPNDMLYWLNISSKSEVIKYLREKGFIVDAKGMDLIKANLKELSEKELNNILIKNNLKIKKDKEDNILSICENIEREQLNQYLKDSAILVTNEGNKLVNDNPQVEVYAKYLYNFNLKRFEQLYQEHKNESVTDTALKYLSEIRNYYVEKMKWNKYALTFEAESRIYKSKNDRINELKSYINYFICIINPWKDNKLEYSNPINIENNEIIIKIVDKSKLSFKKIQELFINQTKEIKLPGLFLSDKDIYEYFKRIYDNEDLRKINKELSEKINLSSFETSSLEFFSKKEQEEVYIKIKNI